MPTTAFDQAIQHLITAIARYHRCGPVYQRKCEAYWVFAAGSYTRQKYEMAVKCALEKLPQVRSFEDDWVVATGLVVKAVWILGGVDER